MVESGLVDTARLHEHLEKGSVPMNSPDPFARHHLKVSLPVSLCRALKAKCKAEGLSPDEVIEDFVTRYLAGTLTSNLKPD